MFYFSDKRSNSHTVERVNRPYCVMDTWAVTRELCRRKSAVHRVYLMLTTARTIAFAERKNTSNPICGPLSRLWIYDPVLLVDGHVRHWQQTPPIKGPCFWFALRCGKEKRADGADSTQCRTRKQGDPLARRDCFSRLCLYLIKSCTERNRMDFLWIGRYLSHVENNAYYVYNHTYEHRFSPGRNVRVKEMERLGLKLCLSHSIF